MQYLEYASSTKNVSVVYLKCRCTWASCILPGHSTGRTWVPPSPLRLQLERGPRTRRFLPNFKFKQTFLNMVIQIFVYLQDSLNFKKPGYGVDGRRLVGLSDHCLEAAQRQARIQGVGSRILESSWIVEQESGNQGIERVWFWGYGSCCCVGPPPRYPETPPTTIQPGWVGVETSEPQKGGRWPLPLGILGGPILLGASTKLLNQKAAWCGRACTSPHPAGIPDVSAGTNESLRREKRRLSCVCTKDETFGFPPARPGWDEDPKGCQHRHGQGLRFSTENLESKWIWTAFWDGDKVILERSNAKQKFVRKIQSLWK